jgi:hypothetical protein
MRFKINSYFKYAQKLIIFGTQGNEISCVPKTCEFFRTPKIGGFLLK